MNFRKLFAVATSLLTLGSGAMLALAQPVPICNIHSVPLSSGSKLLDRHPCPPECRETVIRSEYVAPQEIVEQFVPVTPSALSNFHKYPTESWVSLGPEGGWIGNIMMHPTDHNVLWTHSANSYPTYFFKSTDGGSSWTACGFVNDYIYASTNDPTDPGIIYAAAGNYIYKSRDGAATWSQYQKDTRWSYTNRIYVCPTDHNLVYAAGYYYTDRSIIAIYKSTNGGQSWSVIEVAPTSYQNGYGYSFAADPNDPRILYLGGETYDGTSWARILLKSMDGGVNWTDITGAIDGYAYAIAIDPIHANKLYVATSAGIYRSSDSGQNWQKNNGYAYAYELAIDPKNPDIIYAGAYACIFKSLDAGLNWSTYYGELVGDCTSLLVDHTTTSNIFYGSIVGIFKSSNGGVNWSSANHGIIASSISAIAVAPTDPRILYLEFEDNAVFKTTDSGTHWTRLSEFLACGNIAALAISPLSADVVYALEGYG